MQIYGPEILARIKDYVDLDELVREVDLGAGETFRVAPSGGGVLQATHLPRFKNETPSNGQSPVWNSSNSRYEAGTPAAGIEKYVNTSNSSSASGSGTHEYDISHSIPAGNLNTAGKVMRVTAIGNHTGSGINPTATYWRLKAGSTVLATTNTVNILAASTKEFMIQWVSVVRSTGSSGSVHTDHVDFLYNKTTNGGLTANSTATVDLTAAITLKIDVTWTAAGNSSTLKLFLVEVF